MEAIVYVTRKEGTKVIQNKERKRRTAKWQEILVADEANQRKGHKIHFCMRYLPKQHSIQQPTKDEIEFLSNFI